MYNASANLRQTLLLFLQAVPENITTNQVDLTSLYQIDFNSVVVRLSDAEAQVIKNKAEKANSSINECIRTAALGFPRSIDRLAVLLRSPDPKSTTAYKVEYTSV